MTALEVKENAQHESYVCVQRHVPKMPMSQIWVGVSVDLSWPQGCGKYSDISSNMIDGLTFQYL